MTICNSRACLPPPLVQEWQLQDPRKTVLHWDLFKEANTEKLNTMGKEAILREGQAAADLRETLMFWINQDIIVPVTEWEEVVRKAVAASNAPNRGVKTAGVDAPSAQ